MKDMTEAKIVMGIRVENIYPKTNKDNLHYVEFFIAMWSSEIVGHEKIEPWIQLVQQNYRFSSPPNVPFKNDVIWQGHEFNEDMINRLTENLAIVMNSEYNSDAGPLMMNIADYYHDSGMVFGDVSKLIKDFEKKGYRVFARFDDVLHVG